MMVVEDIMTARETVDIIRESSLWKTLTIKEKVEALAYAMVSVEDRLNTPGEENAADVSDLIGEIFSE
ncbi:MAG: hypothetical protein HZA17_03405 [Nitrospirae bacterium]|nr:hypothetical protein [Nitrospirota bacterium]